MDIINKENLIHALTKFQEGKPFHHCVVDNFFTKKIANELSDEFLEYKSEKWFSYLNPLEDKKALNDWNAFPQLTYAVFNYLNSRSFIDVIQKYVGTELFSDNGLHGGGWHIHGRGGNLNPHLDYSIHPKLLLQRKVNLIIYLSPDLKEEDGGHLGLWNSDSKEEKPTTLAKEISPKFNRAVIFDTTQNSWHGMSRPLSHDRNMLRKSMAVYYLCEAKEGTSPRQRALFAPRENQIGNKEIEDIIKLRSDVKRSHSVYKV
ncbi:2OG-Fe(II) oxygenase [Komagataeibacter europaeus]|uniref:2OG-Fe(II) oxygenase n=1 Tax=Komagataeibacter europaeus TaxID=33995 RepID=UPI0012DF462C|nr:2OG-Fe(II) oxygenase [Komagataeibacter europaeus]